MAKKMKKKGDPYHPEKPMFCMSEGSHYEDLSSGFKKRMKNKLCLPGKQKTTKVKT